MSQRGRTVEFRTVDVTNTAFKTPRSRSLGPRTSPSQRAQFTTSPFKNVTKTFQIEPLRGSTVSPDRGVKPRTSPCRAARFNISSSPEVTFTDSSAQQGLLRKPEYYTQESYFNVPPRQQEQQDEFRNPLDKPTASRWPRNHSVESRSSQSGAADHMTSLNQSLEYNAPPYNQTGHWTLSGQSKSPRIFSGYVYESQAAGPVRTSTEPGNSPLCVLPCQASCDMKEEYNLPAGVDKERILSHSREKEYWVSPSRNDEAMNLSKRSMHHITRHGGNEEYMTPYGRNKECMCSQRGNEEYSTYERRLAEFMNSLEKSEVITSQRSNEDYFNSLQRNKAYITSQRRNYEYMTSPERNNTYMLPPTRNEDYKTLQSMNEGYAATSGGNQEHTNQSNPHTRYVTPSGWRIERLR